MGNPASLVGAQRCHGLEIVQAIRQFDEHDAQVTRHCHQHLAEIFGLGILIGLELNPFQLGQPIDQIGHLFAETHGDLGFGNRRILHHVMQ